MSNQELTEEKEKRERAKEEAFRKCNVELVGTASYSEFDYGFNTGYAIAAAEVEKAVRGERERLDNFICRLPAWHEDGDYASLHYLNAILKQLRDGEAK